MPTPTTGFVRATPLPASLPAAPATTPAPFAAKDGRRLMGAGHLQYATLRDAGLVGWDPSQRRKVDGGFEQALVAAQSMATAGVVAPVGAPDRTSPTHVAAVLQGRSGALYIAPLFARAAADGPDATAFGVELPGGSSARRSLANVLAFVGDTRFIDLR